jgi:hypothetical protein
MTQHLPLARGRHGLRFSKNQWYEQTEASIPLPDSPFGQKTLNIKVDGRSAWQPVHDDELVLLDDVLDWLPELLPFITSKLRAWDSRFEDPKMFRETFNVPSIWLSEQDEQPRKSWTFVIERQEFEGDNWGVHLEFIEKHFQEMWAGD